MTNKKTIIAITIKLPDDLVSTLRNKAESNYRGFGKEIQKRLEDSLVLEKGKP